MQRFFSGRCGGCTYWPCSSLALRICAPNSCEANPHTHPHCIDNNVYLQLNHLLERHSLRASDLVAPLPRKPEGGSSRVAERVIERVTPSHQRNLGRRARTYVKSAFSRLDQKRVLSVQSPSGRPNRPASTVNGESRLSRTGGRGTMVGNLERVNCRGHERQTCDVSR